MCIKKEKGFFVTDLGWVLGLSSDDHKKSFGSHLGAMFLCFPILKISDSDFIYPLIRSKPSRPGVSKLFSLISQIVNTSGFVSHLDSIVTVHFCHCSVKIAVDDT